MTDIEEQHKIGKLAAALNLENLVISDGFLPKLPLLQRAALVKGVIEGMVERGEASAAIRYVWTATPAKGLFDDYAGLADKIIDKVSRSKKSSFTDEARQIITDNWPVDKRYQLAMQPSLHEQDRRKLLDQVMTSLTAEQQMKAYALLGEDALGRDDFVGAFGHFQSANAETKATKVYQRLLKGSDFSSDALFAIVEKSRDDQRDARAAEVIARIFDKKMVWRVAGTLNAFADKHSVALSDAQQEELTDCVARGLSLYEAESCKKPDLRRRWALAHWKDHPGMAYQIFVEQKVEGPDVIAAALQGLQKRHGESFSGDSELHVSDIAPEHLPEVYSKAPRHLKFEIAKAGKRYETLRELSKEYFEDWRKNPEKKTLLNDAYVCWAAGQGAFDDPYLCEVRSVMITEALRENSSHGPYFKDDDVEGHRAWFAQIRADPKCAYKYAHGRNGLSDVLDNARKVYALLQPAEALREFADNQDVVGIELATAALATKHGVSVDAAKVLTDRIVESRKRRQ